MFVSSSAVGYYGTVRRRPENGGLPARTDDFLAELCVEWEQEAQKAARQGMRLVILRAGLVLERSGGALRG